MRRHEPERPRGLVVAAAGDDDGAEPFECGPAAVPVDVGQERMAGAAGAVGVERARVGCRLVLAGGQIRRCPSVAAASSAAVSSAASRPSRST